MYVTTHVADGSIAFVVIPSRQVQPGPGPGQESTRLRWESSGANAITALLGGHVQVVPASVGLWVGPTKAGQARLIAVSAPKRMGGEFADVPTWREQGVDAVVSVWRMITAPPGLTPAQIAYWQEVLRRTTQTPEWKRELEQNYQSDEFITGAELAKTVDVLHAQLHGLLTDLDLVKK